MTKEEAIKVIDNRYEIMDYCESAKLEEALDIAIESLKQSRWIPCSEGMPEEDGMYLITYWDEFTDKSSKFLAVESAFFCTDDSTWSTLAINGVFEEFEDVIAWAILPKPYGDEQE